MNIEQLAIETRNLFDGRLVPKDKIGRLYEAYNPDLIDAREFLEAAEHLFPYLNCGLTAVYLAHQVNDAEIIGGAFNGQNHTYLKIGQRIVDITADQFRQGPAMYVGPHRAPWQEVSVV